MPVKIWHEAAQGGKRTGAEVAGIGRGEGFDAGRDRLALGEIKGANGGLQEGDLATVGFNQTGRSIRMVDCQHEAGQTAAAADIYPVAVRGGEISELRTISEVAFLKVSKCCWCDEVDCRVPFSEQGCVGGQSCFT